MFTARAFWSQGMTLIEILVITFVLAIVAVAVTNLGFIITRFAIEAERKSVAEGIANEEMEIARTYSYAQIEYTDASPPGNIERSKSVERNSQTYLVDSLVTYVDDSLTQETRDFKQLTVKVSWPRAQEGVVLSSFFTPGVRKLPGSMCIPGTVTCPNPDSCDPIRQSCTAAEDFLTCPGSGYCADIPPGGGQTPTPPPTFLPTISPAPCGEDQACPSDQMCLEGTCQPAWCQIVQSAPLVDTGFCEGQLVIEDCTRTCPSWRRLGQLGKLNICGREAYCVITGYTYERCANDCE